MWKEKFEQERACFFECIILKYFSEVFICLARPFAVKHFIKLSTIKNTYFYNGNSSKELEIAANIGSDGHSEIADAQNACAVAVLTITENRDSQHMARDIFSSRVFYVLQRTVVNVNVF